MTLQLLSPAGLSLRSPSLVFTTLFLLTARLNSQHLADSFLVKPYLQFATQESIHVLWETTAPASTVVQYGEALPNAQEPNLSLTKMLEGNRTLHEVQLDNLEVATKYVYRVRSVTESNQEIVSPVFTFNTAVRDKDAIFFALVGDTQYNRRTPWAWGKIADLIWRDRPQFILNAGDLVDQGPRKEDWTGHFFPNGHVAMSRYPMYTVLGNHEQDAQFYYDYMVNPAPEYYYTFKYGNAQFFMIDTNRDVEEGSEQYNWLEWELAKSTATWKFVVHHHPPYSSEENDLGDTYIGASTYTTHARNLVPLYEAHGVDFCLFGHVHMYERSWPLFEDAINLKNGVVYINSGGAGGGLEDFDPSRSWFTQELQTGHHYCTFAIYDQTLVFKAIDHEGRMFDTFQMTKDKQARVSMQQPPAPSIKAETPVFRDYTVVHLEALDPGYEIYYTLDGSTPGRQSARYRQPVRVDQSCQLRTRAFTSDGKVSRVNEYTLRRMDPLPAVKGGTREKGLTYQYYEGEWRRLPDFKSLTPVSGGVVTAINETSFPHRDNHFAVVFEGFVDFPATDTYSIYSSSDDGSRVYIDGELVVDHDGRHAALRETGTIILEKGLHRIRVEYFDATGSEKLSVGIVDPVLGNKPFAPMQFYR